MGDRAKISRHFTVVCRHGLDRSPEQVFDAWTDPAIRREILSRNLYKNGIKALEIREGGEERYEHRWRNRLMGITTRRYLVLRRPRLILAHVTGTHEASSEDQFWASQELILFKPTDTGCELVASSQCVSLEPTVVSAVERTWEESFDAFEQALAK